MYKIFIGLYLLFSVRTNMGRLIGIEGGISAFTKIDWLLAVFCVIMFPLAFVMFYAGYKELKAKRIEQENEQREIEEMEKKRKEEKYEDFSDLSESGSDDSSDLESDASKYDE